MTTEMGFYRIVTVVINSEKELVGAYLDTVLYDLRPSDYELLDASQFIINTYGYDVRSKNYVIRSFIVSSGVYILDISYCKLANLAEKER